MRHTKNSNHPDHSRSLWRGAEAAPSCDPGHCFEQNRAAHAEHPRENELCRFAFAGVMPTPSDRARRLSASCRERVSIGLLRTLQPGELFETRYSRMENGRMEWNLAAFGKGSPDLSHPRSTELALGWQAALHELRCGYRFAPQPRGDSPRNVTSETTVHLQAGGRWLQAGVAPMGFGTRAARIDCALRLPTGMSSPRNRVFSSMADLALAAPVPLELCLRIEPITFTSEKIEHLASALDRLRHDRRTVSSEPLIEAWCGLLEAWLRCRAGFRVSATVSAEHPLPDSFCALATAEIFGSSSTFPTAAADEEMSLDLGKR